MEPRFGVDFSAVRVHSDSTAVQMNKELGAQAFTHGSDIYYGAGKSPAQDDLTAHELTHVVQQTGGVQRKTDDLSAAPTAKESPPQSEAESSNVESVATQVVESLSADPEDRGGRVIGVLARLAPSIRQVVVAKVQAQLSPQQQQTLSRTLARLGSERGAASASQEEISDERSGAATDNQSQPETEPETHQTSQVANENRQSGKSTSKVTSEQSPTPTTETSQVATQTDKNRTASKSAKASAESTKTTDRTSENSPTSPTNSHQKGVSTNSQTPHPKQGNSSPPAKSSGVSSSASTKSAHGSGAPTSAGREGNSGERIAANSGLQSPELQTLSARSQSTQALLDQVAATANNARQRFTDRITQGTEAIRYQCSTAASSSDCSRGTANRGNSGSLCQCPQLKSERLLPVPRLSFRPTLRHIWQA
jgi:hypothetical protein